MREKLPKYICFILITIIILVIVMILREVNNRVDKRQVTVNTLNTEWQKIDSFKSSLSQKDTVRVSVNSSNKSFQNEDIIIKVVEHMLFTEDKEHEGPLDENGIFTVQVSEGNDFTIYAKSLIDIGEPAVDFVTSLKTK